MKKNWFFSILALFILAFILWGYWIGGLILDSSVSDHISAQDKVDYVIILGCGLEGDQPAPILQTRIDTAVEFLEKYPDSVAICTGGQGEDEPMSEASVIERELLKAKIPQSRIKKEITSKNTYENFRGARRIIDQREENRTDLSIAVVTSDFHLHRSLEMASLHGFSDLIKVSAKTPTFLFYPHFAREIVAVAAIPYRYQ